MANWADLGPRLASAAVMALVGLFAVWLGGQVFMVLVLITVALMSWEIFQMCALQPERGRLLLPIAFAAVLYLASWNGSVSFWSVLSSLLLALGFGYGLTKERVLGGLYLLVIFWVGYGLIVSRAAQGVEFILWLLLVVIVSDVMGYFAGRSFGGPKFWPSISPKKTWSGTVAGWVGAGLVGLGFVIWNGSPAVLIGVSVLAAFAGQMGDIAESALKRRTGVKDSSDLIPGHGGVLDRFDALSGAMIFVLLLSLVSPVTV